MNRNSQIIRTSWIGIVANVFLAGFKAAVGLLANSVAIVMDAVNNLSDSLSSVITIVGTKLSQRPADRKHPFGHGRIEYFSAIIIAVIVLSAGVTSLFESAKKILNPTQPEYTHTTLIVIAVAIIVKLVLGRYVKNKGVQLNSDALIASGSDALFDAIITLTTLVSAGVMLLWGISLDGILGVLISIVIIKAGIEMLSSPVNELLGTSIPVELTNQIKKEVSEFEGVHGVYDLILHNYGPDMKIGSLHINVYDTMSAHEIHGLTRKITMQMLARHGIILTVGIYAIATGDNKRAELQTKVLQALHSRKDIVQVHGFYYSEKENTISVDVVPDIAVHDEKALVSQLISDIQPLVPGVHLDIIVDHNYSGGHMEINKDSDSTFVALKNETLKKFKQLTFNDEQTGKTMEYNLLIPEGVEAGEKLPLVLFMADASTAGKEVTAPLTQGYGALEFASGRDQQLHPSFVLVPQYTEWAVQDDWSTTDEVEMTIRLLQSVCKEYNVDTNRLYTTGQSRCRSISTSLIPTSLQPRSLSAASGTPRRCRTLVRNISSTSWPGVTKRLLAA